MVDHPAGSIPTIHPAILIRGGRGGAGNYRLVEPPPTPALVSSAASQSDRSSSTFSKSSFRSSNSAMFATGRGGAGNMHFASERAMFRFDEELVQERRKYQAPAPIYHIGRGGAANFATPPRREERGARFSMESRDSARDLSGDESIPTGRWVIWQKLRGALVPT